MGLLSLSRSSNENKQAAMTRLQPTIDELDDCQKMGSKWALLRGFERPCISLSKLNEQTIVASTI